MSLWRGGLWNSLQSVNGVGPWRGSLWRSEQDSTALAIKKLLFGQGQQGVFYVPQLTVFGRQVLFQDSAGTTPVTADGQPVGYMQDLSGNGNHATQGTAAAKPIYRTDGTLHWLEFDGVDDHLLVEHASKPINSEVYVCAAVVQRGGAKSLITRRSSGAETNWSFFTNGNFWNGSSYKGPLLPNGSEIVYEFEAYASASGWNVERNNILEFDGVLQIQEVGSYNIVIGAKSESDLSELYDSNIYGIVYTDPVPSGAIKGNAASYLASLAGVTL